MSGWGRSAPDRKRSPRSESSPRTKPPSGRSSLRTRRTCFVVWFSSPLFCALCASPVREWFIRDRVVLRYVLATDSNRTASRAAPIGARRSSASAASFQRATVPRSDGDWPKRLGAEVAREVFQFGFETLEFRRVIAAVPSRNRTSIRVVEKRGIRPESHLQRHGRSTIVFSISKSRTSVSPLETVTLCDESTLPAL